MIRTMPCLQMNKLYILGSWSQCMRKNERGLSMNRNSQTRMTNDQIRRNDEIRMTKPMTAQLRAFGHSGFGFLSSFVIRHSFVIQRLMQIRFIVPMHARSERGLSTNTICWQDIWGPSSILVWGKHLLYFSRLHGNNHGCYDSKKPCAWFGGRLASPARRPR